MHSIGAEDILHLFGDAIRIDVRTARKNIQSGIAVLRPGMNRYMRFGNYNCTAYAVGIKLMKYAIYYGSAGFCSRFNKRLLEKSVIVQNFLITIEEFDC